MVKEGQTEIEDDITTLLNNLSRNSLCDNDRSRQLRGHGISQASRWSGELDVEFSCDENIEPLSILQRSRILPDDRLLTVGRSLTLSVG